MLVSACISICVFVSLFIHTPHVSLVVAVPNSASNLQATATVDSLKPTWVAPTAGGDVTYTVTLKDGASVKETKEDITETTTTFNVLTAGKQYTIMVVSVIGGQNSDPLQGNFYTSKEFISLNVCRVGVLSDVRNIDVMISEVLLKNCFLVSYYSISRRVMNFQFAAHDAVLT